MLSISARRHPPHVQRSHRPTSRALCSFSKHHVQYDPQSADHHRPIEILQDKFQRCATGAEQNQNRAPKQPNRAIEELAGRVAEKLNKPRGFGYVERCRDYIQKHYREKIYLEDIAETLGLSPTYLSRLFKKETGIFIQDAINEERVFRAANLLLYSELSLTEIAQYVGFPNQSYMGKIFKKLRNMTPMTYRDRLKNQEAGI